MPVGFNSPARNLFLLGSSGAQTVTNFFKSIDQSSTTDGVFLPDEIRYNYTDQKYFLAGSASDNNSRGFGWFEKRDEAGALDFANRVQSTVTGVNTTLRAMELDINNNLIVAGFSGTTPWIAKYSNAGVLDWQSTTNSANVRYTGLASDSNGNYYASGRTSYLLPDTQAFVEKFDSNGNPGWGKSAFILGRDVVLRKISANSRGEVVAVGFLEDDSADKGYIVKIDTSTGEVLWDRTLERNISGFGLGNPSTGSTDSITPADVRCMACYIDSNDQIYVVGSIDGNSPNDNGVGEFLIKYSPEGNIIWQRENNTTDYVNLDGAPNMVPFDVKSDGETEQTVVLSVQDQGAFALNNSDVFISKYSKNGDLVYRRQISKGAANLGNASLDADPSFYYILFEDQQVDGLAGTPDRYTFGKVSTSGNGLGAFQYDDGAAPIIDYTIVSNAESKIGRLSDGSVRNDSSDLITYPFTANKLVFDDLATHVSNKKRQMDSADSFEYSGSPAIRIADFQKELNLLGDVYSGSGDWLDQSGKGNDGVVNGATHNAAGYWDFDGTNDTIDLGTTSLIAPSSSFSIEAWCWVDSLTAECTIYEISANGNPGSIMLSAGSNFDGNVGGRFFVRNTSGSDIGVRDVINNNLGEWHHYVGVHNNNASSSDVTLYVDGVATQSDTAITTHAFDFTNVGVQHLGLSSGNRYLDGRIGEIRIYSKALTAAQVFQNYNATKTKYINEAPDTAPRISSDDIVYDNPRFIMYYDFGNRATYDPAENVVRFSEDFTITGSGRWASAGNLPDANVTPNYGLSPFGEMKATRMINTDATPKFRRWQPNVTANGNYDTSGQWNCSVYAKALSNPCTLRINSYDGVSDKGSYFDLVNGAALSSYGSPDGTSVEAVGNGWYRISQTTTNAANGGDHQLHLDPGSDMLVFGAQMERGNTPGRYIKTSGTAITATKVNNLLFSSVGYEKPGPGTISGPVWNPAGYFEFGQSTQSAITGPFDYNDGSYRDFTVEAWIYGNNWNVNGDSYSGILNRSDGSSHIFSVYINTSGEMASWYFNDGGSIIPNTSSTDGDPALILQTGVWNHCVWIHNDGAAMEYYLNNSAASTYSNTNTRRKDNSNQTFTIGKWNVGGYELHGRIGELRFYNRKLFASEISQNFNATRGKYGV